MNGKVINAKFNSTCAETGKKVTKGEQVWYAFNERKVYCSTSKRYAEEIDAQATAQFIMDEQNAYYDNFCQANNI